MMIVLLVQRRTLHIFLVLLIFSFSELKTIRIAFDVYECQDLSGMEVCPHIILRTLKVSYIYIHAGCTPKKLLFKLAR